MEFMVSWHEKLYMCWAQQVGIDTPLGEKPGSCGYTLSPSVKAHKNIERRAASYGENSKIRGLQMQKYTGFD